MSRSLEMSEKSFKQFLRMQEVKREIRSSTALKLDALVTKTSQRQQKAIRLVKKLVEYKSRLAQEHN